jgi:hypothetical protein
MRSALKHVDVKNDDGNVTVEFVIWFPVLIFLLLLTVDVTLSFVRHSHMWRVANEVTRSVSTGRLRSGDVPGRVAAMSQGPTAYSASISHSGNLVTTRVSLPLRNAGLMGILAQFGDNDLVTSVTMELQPHVTSIN